MPTIPLHPPSSSTADPSKPLPQNPLPPLLHTPSGLAIVEIQGTIHMSAPTSSDPAEPASPHHPVGTLIFPHYSPTDPASSTAWMKRVHLYVGRHQRLTGEVRKLGRPVGVVRRKAVEGQKEGQGEELEIVDVVRWKIVFGSRPEPVGGSE